MDVEFECVVSTYGFIKAVKVKRTGDFIAAGLQQESAGGLKS